MWRVKDSCEVVNSTNRHFWGLTQAFRGDTATFQGVVGPVVVLEGVHELQDGAHSTDGAVDGGGANKFCRQVCVEGKLYLKNGKHNELHDLKWAERVVTKTIVLVLDSDWTI